MREWGEQFQTANPAAILRRGNDGVQCVVRWRRRDLGDDAVHSDV
jgi:hypothetical protein